MLTPSTPLILRLLKASGAMALLIVMPLDFMISEVAPPGKYQPIPERKVDPSTLTGKLVFGYQGWFSTPTDGSPLKVWNHWSIKRDEPPSPENARMQMWPDMSELEPDELHETNLKYKDGSNAKLYSAWNPKTVMRHFRWMKEYNLDGAMPYRFISRFSSQPEYRAFYNKVLDNIRLAAEAQGRVFAVQYDISGYKGSSVVKVIQEDWKSLVDDLKITESPMYLHHKGKPFVVLRNLGNSVTEGKRLMTPQEALELITWFKRGAPEKYQTTLMGALPSRWRTQGSDTMKEPEWAKVFRSFDVVSAWPVGRFRDDAGVEEWKEEVLLPDLKECAALGIDYMPAVYPGFSYNNAKPEKEYNSIPRLGGRFYWHQVHNAVSANATMIYNAMFDEVDEGTAMFKVSPSPETQPTLTGKRRFLPLNADGETLPSDWYLKLADYASRMLRKEIPLTATRPINP